eukprot:SM000202S05882  [mRNA]  locus=s202:198851:203326:+ [translate_table: standard]
MAKKRGYSRWSDEEEHALCSGVQQYGEGKWKRILADPRLGRTLLGRTNVDLKDKWRTMSSAEAASKSRWGIEQSHSPLRELPVSRAITRAVGANGAARARGMFIKGPEDELERVALSTGMTSSSSILSAEEDAPLPPAFACHKSGLIGLDSLADPRGHAHGEVQSQGKKRQHRGDIGARLQSTNLNLHISEDERVDKTPLEELCGLLPSEVSTQHRDNKPDHPVKQDMPQQDAVEVEAKKQKTDTCARSNSAGNGAHRPRPLLLHLWKAVAAATYAGPFRRLAALPDDYVGKIQKPCCLTSIRRRIEDDAAYSLKALERDLLLMMTNAMVFYKAGSVQYDMASQLKSYTRKLMKEHKDAAETATTCKEVVAVKAETSDDQRGVVCDIQLAEAIQRECEERSRKLLVASPSCDGLQPFHFEVTRKRRTSRASRTAATQNRIALQTQQQLGLATLHDTHSYDSSVSKVPTSEDKRRSRKQEEEEEEVAAMLVGISSGQAFDFGNSASCVTVKLHTGQGDHPPAMQVMEDLMLLDEALKRRAEKASKPESDEHREESAGLEAAASTTGTRQSSSASGLLTESRATGQQGFKHTEKGQAHRRRIGTAIEEMMEIDKRNSESTSHLLPSEVLSLKHKWQMRWQLQLAEVKVEEDIDKIVGSHSVQEELVERPSHSGDEGRNCSSRAAKDHEGVALASSTWLFPGGCSPPTSAGQAAASEESLLKETLLSRPGLSPSSQPSDAVHGLWCPRGSSIIQWGGGLQRPLPLRPIASNSLLRIKLSDNAPAL